MSKNLLLKYSDADNYYLGEYHYHPENSEMGFCTGKHHTENSISNLQPITISNIDNPLNDQVVYKKQMEIYKDDQDWSLPESMALINIKSLSF